MPVPDQSRPLLVDPRVGSKELSPFLFSLGLPTEELHLDYGDFAFEGHGHSGPALIGIERKCLGDMLQSMRSGRLAGHQLSGLLSTYSTTYLVVEGVYRRGHDGFLERPGWRRNGDGRSSWEPVKLGSSTFLFSELDNFLTSLENIAGLKIRLTSSKTQTAQVIESLYRWWGKPWEKHKSLGVIYTPGPKTLDLVEPSLLRKMAVQLPGVGWEKSMAVERKWRTALDMVLAEEGEWESLPGIGKKMARQIVQALRTPETD
jgi:ERCC4-type nuclease